MPTESDDDNHDQIVSTTTITGVTTAITPGASQTSLPASPTDHPDRPVNAKPTGTTEEESTPSSSTSSTATPSSWLPSIFPAFGMSSKTQIWVYGAVALIVLFCAAVGVYLFMARRKRLRNNSRDEWEFDLLEDEEAEGLTGGKTAGRNSERRLYALARHLFATGPAGLRAGR